MAFVGHPILAEIRKGTRLRPTQTVDKSRPMIRAEGEQVPSVQPRGPAQAEPVAFSPPPPAANFAAVQRPAAQQQMMSSAPPPPPPPPGSNNSNGNRFAQQKPQQQPAAAPTGGRQDEAGHRQKLLNEIRGGVRLRHVQTVDKSGLVLSEEEQQQLLRAGTPNGSLDSQGKSPSPSMVAFSPASSSSVLSPSPPVINGWPSASSSPAQRCSPSPTGGPGQQQQQRSNQPAVRHWPEVQTEAERQAAHNRQHSDYQFDEQKQIEERQKEVAALTGVGSASSKIAAFRQLLQQPTASTLPAHCTLPRAPKTTATWKNGAAATNGGGPTQQQRPPAAAKNNVNGQPPQQSQQQKRPPTQQMGNGQQQQQQQKPQQTMLNGQQRRVAVANGGGQPQQNGLNRCNSHGQAQQPTPMASTPTSFHQQHQNQQQQQQQPHYHQQMPSPAAAAPKWQQPQPQAMIPVCPPPPRPAFQQQKNGFVSSTPAAPAAARSPQAAPFFRSYTPRATGGAHRQNFDRIRGQFKGAAGGPAEEPPQERGAEAVWKNAARQRKEQQQQLPPPLPSCPPPPLDGSQPPEWETLREQFKFAVDLDSGPEGKALIRIVRR